MVGPRQTVLRPHIWCVALVGSALLVAAPAALAQDATWLTTPASNDFNVPGNWTPGAVPGGLATFGTSSITTLTFFSASRRIDGFIFDPGAPGYTFDLSSGFTLRFQADGIINHSANAPTFNVSNSPLIFDDSSTAGNAIINLNAGTVQFLNTSTAGTAELNAATGTTFDFTGTMGPASNGIFTAGSISGEGNFDLGANNRLVVGSNDLSTTVSGIISGGAITKVGTGTLTLSGANTYGGGTTISGGTVAAVHLDGGGIIDALGTGNITLDGGALKFGVSGTLQNAIAFSDNKTSIVSAGSQAVELSNSVSLGAAATAQFGVAGDSGTITLSGAGGLVDTTAALVVAGGTLKDGGNAALTGLTFFTASTTVSAGAVLDFNDSTNQAIRNLAGNGSVVTGTAGVTTLSLYVDASTTSTFGGVISGPGSVLVQTYNAGSGGTMVLTGNNTYTGNTTICNCSTLQLGNGGTTGSILGDVVNGGTLAFNRSDSVATPYVFSGSISDDGGSAGKVSLIGTGAVLLSGSNSYSGGTTLSSGTLIIGNSSALGLGDLSMAQGTTLSFDTLAAYNVANNISIAGDPIFNVAAGPAQTVSGVISDSDPVTNPGIVEKNGAGTLILSGDNTYSGGTVINAGTLQVTSSNPGVSSSVGIGDVTLNGGTFQADGSTDLEFSNNFKINTAGGAVDNSGTILTLSGIISNGNGTTGVLQITDSSGGFGTTVLSGANTYSGGTTVIGTTVQVTNSTPGVSSSVGTGTVTLDAARFQADGLSNLTFSNNFIINNSFSFASAFDNGGATLTLSGVIGNGTDDVNGRFGTVSFTGSGTTILTGSNIYTGGTDICNCGTLQLGTTGSTGSILGAVTNEGIFEIVNANTSGITTITNKAGAFTTFRNSTDAGTMTIDNLTFGTVEFRGNSSAASATINNNISASVKFFNSSTAGNATINNLDGFGFFPAVVEFNTLSKAGTATINNAGGSWIVFNDRTTLENAKIINNDGGLVLFNSQSTAGTTLASITNNDAGEVQFTDRSKAGSATITNNDFGSLSFSNRASADNATIVNSSAFGMDFFDQSTAGNAFITTKNNSGTFFSNRSDGGTARFETEAGSIVDFSGSRGPNADGKINAGSIAGGGDYYIGGGNTLSVGGNNLSTEVSGLIADNNPCGCTTGPGALTKVGTGTLILSGTNTYTGGTTITAGTLQLGNGIALMGSILGNVTDNATLAFNRPDTYQFDGAISGSGVVQQNGSGTTILTAVNTYAGSTTISAGTLALSGAGSIANSSGVIANGTFDISATTAGASIKSLSGNGIVTLGNQTLTLTNASGTFAGAIGGNGGLLKQGAGLFTLTGTNTYLGGTAVAGGELRVNGSVASAVTVQSGATLSGIGSVGGLVTVQSGGTLSAGQSPGTFTLGALNLNAGSTSIFELGTPGVAGGATNDLVNVTGNLTLGGTLSVNAPSAGYYRLFNYGTLTASNFGAINGSSNGTPTVLTNVPNQINLLIAGAGQQVQFWDGADQTGNGVVNGGAGTWNAANTNWTGAPGQANINDQWRSSVGVFAGTAGTVTVVGTQAFDTLQFSTTDYVLNAGAGGQLQLAGLSGTGTINTDGGVVATINAPIVNGGSQSLTKVGGGTLILTAANTYTGGTTISGGTLQLGNGGTTGSIVGNVTDNGIFAIKRSDAFTFSGMISGSGAFQQLGTGTTILTADNNYSGGTTISAGTLQLGNGGTTGSIVGNVTNNGVLAVNRSSALALGGVISGSGAFQQLGTGTTTLSGANTYTGPTTVTAGTLAISGTGSITSNVSNNATFTNAGTVNGSLTNAGTASNSGTIANGLTNTAGTTTNTGTIGGGATVSGGTLNTNAATSVVNGGLTNAGTVNARNEVNGAIVNQGAGVFNVVGNLAHNNTFMNSGAAQLAITSGNFTGLTTLTNNSTNAAGVSVAAGFTLSANAVNNNTGGFIVNAGTLTSLGGPVNNAGTLNSNTVTSVINGGLTNTGTVNAQNQVNGAIVNQGAGAFNVGGNLAGNNSFTNNGTAQLAITGGNFTGITTLTNNSTNATGINIAVGNTLSATNVANNGGATLSNTGTLTSDNVITNAGNTGNGGTINGGVNNTGLLGNAGIVNGGVANSGTTGNGGTINGGLTNTAGSTSNDGTINGGATVNGGALTTTGTVAGGIMNSATVNAQGMINGAILNQGAGVFTVTGNLAGNNSFANNGTAQLLVNGGNFTGITTLTNNSTNSAGVSVSATSTLSTTGTVTNGAGANIAVNGTFTAGQLLTNSGVVLVNNGGTLIATVGGITNNAGGTITVALGGTVKDDLNNAGIIANNGAYVANVATNTGNITDAATGTWAGNVLSNAAAISNSGGWTGNVASNLGTIDNNKTWTGTIANAGAFNNNAGATVSGLLTNTAGTIVNNGALNGGANVSGGTLTGSGTVTNLVVSGGIFAPGNGTPGSSMTVSGNLAFQSGAMYLVALNPTTASFANVGGTASLNGTAVAVYLAGSYVSKKYTILTAAGGVSGAFGSIVNTNVPANFTSTLSYDANNAYINLTLNFVPNPAPNFGSGLNINQQNVANTLVNFFNSTGGIPAVFGSLSPNGLTQVSGELATGSQQTTFDAMNLFLGLLTDPFVAGRGNGIAPPTGASQFAEANDTTNAYAASGKPRSKSEREAYAAVYRKASIRETYDPRWSVWAAGYGGSQTTDGNAALGSNTATSRVFGTAVGADYLFSPRTIAGFALAGGGTNFSVNGLGTGRSDLFQAGAFVRHTNGPAYISAALAYGWQDVTTDRTVATAGGGQLRATFNANAFSGRVEGGYRFATPWMAVGLTPYAAGQFTTFDLPAYAEQAITGANTFALGYAAKSVTASRSEFGLRSDKSFAMQDGIFTLRGRAAWAHNFNPDRNIAATFQTLPGASFVVNGAAQASDAALVTGSAEMKWLNGFSLAATFEGEFSNVTRSYAGKGVVRYAW